VIQHEGDPSRCAVLLPGVRYFSQAPLIWFSREAAQARGWSAVEVDERAPGDQEPFEWMRGQALRALDAADAKLTVVVGKSLGSAAAPLVSERGLPAVWLTPLLIRPDVTEALAAASAPALAIGSPDDPSWGQGELPDNPALEVLELAGLDHSLQVSGDPIASLDVLRTVTERVGAFFDRVAGTP
jgi:hypothetical protein